MCGKYVAFHFVQPHLKHLKVSYKNISANILDVAKCKLKTKHSIIEINWSIVVDQKTAEFNY